MYLLKSLTFKTFFLISLILLSLAIALHLPGYNWETDYGHHYYISMFNDKFTNLYQNFHFHKGPISIFILDALGLIIGHGWKQSIVSYAIIIFLFFSINFLTILKNSRNIIYVLLSTIFMLTFFRSQGSNIFHDLVVNIFLLSSMYFFLNYLINENKKDILYFSLFYTAAILTRIDTLIYSIPFFLSLLIIFNKKKKIKDLNFKFFLQNTGIFCFIFFLLSIIYNFSFEDFLLNNIYFNIEYSKDFQSYKNLSYLYHLLPNKIILFIIILKSIFYLSDLFSKKKIYRSTLFLVSIIQFILFFFKLDNFLLFFSSFILEAILITFLFLKEKENHNLKLLFTSYMLCTSIFIYLKAGSFKLNHVFFLYAGFFYFYCFFTRHLFTQKLKFKKILILILVILSLDQCYKIFNSIKNPITRNDNLSFGYGISNLFYNKNVIENNELIKKINEYNAPILCDRSWPHIFNERESIGFMFDWWMFDKNKISINKKYFEKLYDDILSKNYSNYYILDKECTGDNLFSKSNYLIKLNINSTEINEIKFFENKYLLKKLYE